MRDGQAARRRRAQLRSALGRESPGVSVADVLSWAVSHDEGRVTQSIRSVDCRGLRIRHSQEPSPGPCLEAKDEVHVEP
jgi:hypothetical protein